MKFLQQVALLFLFLTFYSTTVTAIVTPIKPEVTTKTTHRLKFKEKAAHWLLKRKLRNANRRLSKALSASPLLSDTTKCATILLKTGDKIKGIFVNTTDNSILFKRCGKENQEISLNKSSVDKVILPDGIVLYDSIIETRWASKRKDGPRKGLGVLAGFSIVTGLLSIAFSIGFAILLVLLGIIFVFIQRKRNKEWAARK